MPHLHLTDLKLKSLANHPPAKPKQIDYFDDVTKGGVRGLLLKHSYGGTLTWFVMYYEGAKSKVFKLGKYPVLKLAPARQAALAFLGNPKEHVEKREPPKTFANVVEEYFTFHVAQEHLRTAKVIRQRIEKHLMPTF